jgi:hypothetical protein
MTDRELRALVAWTNALGPTLELGEPIDVTSLGSDGEHRAGLLESAGVIDLRDADECLACGGWDGHHLEEHPPAATRRKRVLSGRPTELLEWVLAALGEGGWSVDTDPITPTVLTHAVETSARVESHPVRVRLAVGQGEPPLALAPGERVLRLRLGAAPALFDIARVVDVDAAKLLRDEAEQRRVLSALERIEVLTPLPLFALESDLNERDRSLIIEAFSDFLRVRGYQCGQDPNTWSRVFTDLGVEASRGIIGCTNGARGVLLVLCRCTDMRDRLHVHGFVAARPRPALDAEPALRQLIRGLGGLYNERVELRHRGDNLKEMKERMQLVAGVIASLLSVGLAGWNLKPELLSGLILALVLLRSHVRYAFDLLRLMRWDWHSE